MKAEAFERIAAEEFAQVPAHFKARIQNVALLIEDEPSVETRAAEGLKDDETLLGLYHGIPANARGDFYSGVLPDTITLYRAPLLEEAALLREEGRAQDEEESVRLAVRETLWHELGHYFGLPEEAVHAREEAGTNRYDGASYAHTADAHGSTAAPGGMLYRARSPGRSPMAKTFARAFGIIFILFGLVGFVNNPLVGTDALFATDVTQSLIFIILGALLSWVAFSATSATVLSLKAEGVLLFLLGAIGILSVPAAGGYLLGIAYTNGASNWLTLIVGMAVFASGMYGTGPLEKGPPTAE